MAHATVADYHEIAGSTEAALTAQLPAALEEASLLLDSDPRVSPYTETAGYSRLGIGFISVDSEFHRETLKRATVAQVQYWVALGDGTTVVDGYDTLGIRSVNAGQVNIPIIYELAPRAMRVLRDRGSWRVGLVSW